MEPPRTSCKFHRWWQIVHRRAHCTTDKQSPHDATSCSPTLLYWALDLGENIRTCSWRYECWFGHLCKSRCSNRSPSAAIRESDDTIALPTSSRCARSTSIADRTFLMRSSSRDADCSLQTCTASHAQRRSCCATWTPECKDNDRPAIRSLRNTPAHREHDWGYQNFDIRVAVEIRASPNCTRRRSFDRQCIQFGADRA